ncbi:hypothetical protein LOK49_LG05G00750 [Camellia lanceoleosa]|uniref:Uncharacterized protein n=1 Tax=Camellia lanceoleosa TaxID=1840588 RepID=A0ACC0HSJ4_9ERIC|nr:hypothetical protein LOK49_LG05G00750 [Camellia lanceoleosa]
MQVMIHSLRKSSLMQPLSVLLSCVLVLLVVSYSSSSSLSHASLISWMPGWMLLMATLIGRAQCLLKFSLCYKCSHSLHRPRNEVCFLDEQFSFVFWTVFIMFRLYLLFSLSLPVKKGEYKFLA